MKMTDRMDPIRPTVPVPGPELPRRLCAKCGRLLDPTLRDESGTMHVTCPPLPGGDPPPDGVDKRISGYICGLLEAYSSSRPRSRQQMLGPSEVGHPCDRRLFYRLAGVPRRFQPDPWPALVGTSVHAELEKVLDFDNRRSGNPTWKIETRVTVEDLLIAGTCDAYHIPSQTVMDWKTFGVTAGKTLMKSGPDVGYWVQVQLYGLGMVRAGFPVDTVSLMFMPKSGLLSGAVAFSQPFDPQVAHQAIERVRKIATMVGLASEAGDPNPFQKVSCEGAKLCGWCPYYRKVLSPVSECADAGGCPGK